MYFYLKVTTIFLLPNQNSRDYENFSLCDIYNSISTKQFVYENHSHYINSNF